MDVLTGSKNEFKYLTYDILRALNRKAIRNKLNRAATFSRLPIAKDELYPVIAAFVHNDQEVRTRLVLNTQGDTVFLDMSFKDFARLPTRVLNEEDE